MQALLRSLVSLWLQTVLPENVAACQISPGEPAWHARRPFFHLGEKVAPSGGLMRVSQT
jgi:hypothetical protein